MAIACDAYMAESKHIMASIVDFVQTIIPTDFSPDIIDNNTHNNNTNDNNRNSDDDTNTTTIDGWSNHGKSNNNKNEVTRMPHEWYTIEAVNAIRSNDIEAL